MVVFGMKVKAEGLEERVSEIYCISANQQFLKLEAYGKVVFNVKV